MKENWIDIKENKPEIDQEVIVGLSISGGMTCCFTYKGVCDATGRDIWWWHNSDDESLLPVAAWQPLPDFKAVND